MSPRVISIPLSGGDRKFYARQLKRAEKVHEGLVRRVADARKVAREYQRMLSRLECEEWSARQFIGGDLEPSPTIAQAIDADCVLLLVECRACGHGQRVDLTEVVWPREKPIHTLGNALICVNCKREGRSKRRPNLVGLQTHEPENDPPEAAARRS